MYDYTPNIDVERLAELIEDYDTARRRSEQREIEQEVLRETVWKVRDPMKDDQFTLSRDDLRTLAKRIDEDDQEARRILRKPFLRDL